MIPSCVWPLFRVVYRYRSVVNVFFLLIALTYIYCLVLGTYVTTIFEQVAVQPNKSHNEQDATKNKPTHYVYNTELTIAPTPAPPRPAVVGAPVAHYPARIEPELDERRRTLAQACKKYDLGDEGSPNAWEFFIDTAHHIVWCNVFKAASSTWMYYFNLLGGYKSQYLRRTNKVPLILARAKFPRPSVAQLRAALPTSLSFLVVREPFQRLLSAFRNKIENSRHRFYRKMANEMVVKYRTPLTGPLSSPTFPEFVSYVVERATKEQSPYDEHWAPYHKFCTPCHVNFTVVAKLETFERDKEYIITKAGVQNILVQDVRKRNPKSVMNRAKDGRSTKSLVKKYYSQLTLAQVQALYEIYKIDFDMFGYDATEYFLMAKKSEMQDILLPPKKLHLKLI